MSIAFGSTQSMFCSLRSLSAIQRSNVIWAIYIRTSGMSMPCSSREMNESIMVLTHICGVYLRG
jgi:hypothetical protein